MNVQSGPLSDYPSLLEFCKELGLSKQRLKKYLKSSELSKKVIRQNTLELPINLVNHYIDYCQYNGPEVEVVLEDESFFVVNKPVNIHSHSLEYTQGNSVNCFIRSKNKLGDFVLDNSFEKGLLHRLDFETSGVLIYVKKKKIWDDVH